MDPSSSVHLSRRPMFQPGKRAQRHPSGRPRLRRSSFWGSAWFLGFSPITQVSAGTRREGCASLKTGSGRRSAEFCFGVTVDRTSGERDHQSVNWATNERNSLELSSRFPMRRPPESMHKLRRALDHEREVPAASKTMSSNPCPGVVALVVGSLLKDGQPGRPPNSSWICFKNIETN